MFKPSFASTAPSNGGLPTASTFNSTLPSATTFAKPLFSSFSTPATGQTNMFSTPASSTSASLPPFTTHASNQPMGASFASSSAQPNPFSTCNIAQEKSFPELPGKTKFLDLPQHIKEALFSLEKTIKETSHKAAVPITSITSIDDGKAQIDQVEKLLVQLKMKLITDMGSFEDLRSRENNIFSDVEMVLFCFEKFKDPGMRHTLSSLDAPIEKYFKTTISSFEQILHLLKRRIDINHNSTDTDGTCDLLKMISNNDLLVVKFKEYLKSIVQIAGEVCSLETQLTQLEAGR